MELFLEAGQNYAFLLQLIVDYLKLTERRKVVLIHLSQGALSAIKANKLMLQVPSLVTSEGIVQTEIFQICKKLFELLPQWKTFFLGEGDETTEIAEVKTHLKEGKELRKYLQKHLEQRTFFVGTHITFADFYMFTQLYDNLLQMTDEQKIQYNNLFRWYKHIQNLPQIKEYLLKHNRFLIEDPVPKYPFLAEKKKPKKEKKEEGATQATKLPQKKQVKNETKQKSEVPETSTEPKQETKQQ